MTKSSKVLTVLLSIAVLGTLVCGVAFLSKKLLETMPTQKIKYPPNERTAIDPAGITYDAKITIPDTGVTVSYPKKGYNGKGVRLEKSKRGSLSVFESIGNLYIFSAPSSSPQIAVSVYRLENQKTWEDVIITLNLQMTDTSLGHYETMNGIQYFLVPSGSGDPIYIAYALVKGQLLGITLLEGFYRSNPDTVPNLLRDFLSHVDFTCTSDCSVNADIVTDTSMKEGQ